MTQKLTFKLINLTAMLIATLYSEASHAKEELDALIRTSVVSLPSINLDGKKYHILDGDMRVTVDEGIKLLKYNREFLLNKENDNERHNEFEHAVALTNGGALSKWPNSTILTYSLNTSGLTIDQAALLERSATTAASNWNDACKTLSCPKFKIVESKDNAVFQVVYFPTNHFYASAFFPHDEGRIVLISDLFFTQKKFNHSGIMQHEFGHILGFRHEQILNPNLQECQYEKGEWKAFGNYHPTSVMHYLCDGGGTSSLDLSPADISMVNQLYKD